MERIIEDKTILTPPGLYGVVGGGFVCVFGFVGVFLFVFVCLFYSMKNFAPFCKGECRIPFLVV